MRSLQSWRRRTMTSLRKLSAITHFLHHHHRRGHRNRHTAQSAQYDERAAIQSLLDDFAHIAAHVTECGRRLENTLPVVPSMLQLAESRLSLRETENVRRLTYLALVFVPLSFAASLFSMDAAFAPGGPRFWVYVVVAVPLTALVFAIARLPVPGRCWEHGLGTVARTT